MESLRAAENLFVEQGILGFGSESAHKNSRECLPHITEAKAWKRNRWFYQARDPPLFCFFFSIHRSGSSRSFGQSSLWRDLKLYQKGHFRPRQWREEVKCFALGLLGERSRKSWLQFAVVCFPSYVRFWNHLLFLNVDLCGIIPSRASPFRVTVVTEM